MMIERSQINTTPWCFLRWEDNQSFYDCIDNERKIIKILKLYKDKYICKVHSLYNYQKSILFFFPLDFVIIRCDNINILLD